jgi:hypothetical protein
MLARSLEATLERLSGNPRFDRVREHVESELRARLPRLRELVQLLLARIEMHPRPSRASRDGGPQPQRTPLGAGSHSEVELSVEDLGWMGKADLISVGDDICEIADFKTGNHDEEAHAFQLRLYALLWSRDAVVNPEGRLANRLRVIYGGTDVEVPAPSHAELASLAEEARSRRESALDALSTRPPKATPSVDSCRYCGVKQLCDEYWSQATQEVLERDRTAQDGPWRDVEVEVGARHGPNSWDGRVVIGAGLAKGAAVLLRFSATDTTAQAILAISKRVRLIGAVVSKPGDSPLDTPLPILALGAWSELFKVN